MTDTQSIKDRLDIVQIISEYVSLKKAGINWKANCPFHNEKSPSFMVQPEKQFWHCFGCGKGGDVFTFIQEMEGLEFAEALKILADRAGVKLDRFASEVNTSQKNRILEINNKAAYFFHHFLLEVPAAAAAREYLNRRGLSAETIADWSVGFIPDQWDLLVKYLLKKGNSIDDLLLSGLVIKKDGGGFYDRFRGRVMFPIWDTHGNTVGFTGRILVETEKSGGKYVNTPQTLVFDKSRILYGLNKAKTDIKSKDLAVLVEGQMDVIACHQAGMKNVVASSGTALTLEQVRLLKRYSNNIAIAFDADAAGQMAGKRGTSLSVQSYDKGNTKFGDKVIEEGMNAKVIQIPTGAGKDADECLKKNPVVWFEAVKNAKDIMEWYFSVAFAGLDKRDPKQKQKISDTLLSEIVRLPHMIERDHWLNRLADELGVDRSILAAEAKRIYGLAAKNAAYTHVPASAENMQAPAKEEKTKAHILLENFFALLFKFPSFLAVYAPELKKDFLEEVQLAGLYDSLKKYYNENTNILDVQALKNSLTTEERFFVDILVLKSDKDYANFTREEAQKELTVLFSAVKEDWQKNKRNKLAAQLKEAEKNNNREQVQNILKEIVALG